MTVSGHRNDLINACLERVEAGLNMRSLMAEYSNHLRERTANARVPSV